MSEETKELLIDLQQYIDEPNNQDINGEYEPPRELEQGEARLLLDLITNLQNQLQQKDNIIKEVREYIMTELITEWDIKNDGYVSGSDLPVDAITPILEILDKVDKV